MNRKTLLHKKLFSKISPSNSCSLLPREATENKVFSRKSPRKNPLPGPSDKRNFSEETFFLKTQQNDLQYLKEFYRHFRSLPPKAKSQYKFTLKIKDGSLATHFAAWHQNEELIEFLIEQKADFNIPNNDSVTPLMIACFLNSSNPNIFNHIFSQTRNFNLQDHNGFTALHYAAISNNLVMVKKLLQVPNIDPFIKNNQGQTIVDLAKDPVRLNILMQNVISETRPTIFQKFKTPDTSNVVFSPETEMDCVQTQALPKSNYKGRTSRNPQNHSQSLTLEEHSIEDYVIHSMIGQGSFGQVFLAQEKKSNQFFAIKALNKELIVRENLVDYAYTEKIILMNISHPFIVKLHRAFQNQCFLFLVMDFHPGKDLSYYIQNKFPEYFDDNSTRNYFCEILLALEELHKHNIIFRDLKPENIILDCEGHIKLIDFGLAKINVTD